jgi:hypothetical protein
VLALVWPARMVRCSQHEAHTAQRGVKWLTSRFYGNWVVRRETLTKVGSGSPLSRERQGSAVPVPRVSLTAATSRLFSLRSDQSLLLSAPSRIAL